MLQLRTSSAKWKKKKKRREMQSCVPLHSTIDLSCHPKNSPVSPLSQSLPLLKPLKQIHMFSILVVLPFQKYHTKWTRTHAVFLVWFSVLSKNEFVSGTLSILLLNNVPLYVGTTPDLSTCWRASWLSPMFSNYEQSGYKGFVPVLG